MEVVWLFHTRFFLVFLHMMYCLANVVAHSIDLFQKCGICICAILKIMHLLIIFSVFTWILILENKEKRLKLGLDLLSQELGDFQNCQQGMLTCLVSQSFRSQSLQNILHEASRT